VAEHRGAQPAAAPRALAELRPRDPGALAEQIAGRWIVALVGSHPLVDLGQLPLQALAREAPQLCRQAVEAVSSDVALARLDGPAEPGGDPAAGGGVPIGEMTGARSAADLVRALELLRGVVTESLLEQLQEPSSRQTADLCERVAHVCSVALGGALATEPGGAATGARGGHREYATASGERTAEVSGVAAAAAGGVAVAGAPGEPPLIVDELDHPRAGASVGPSVTRAPTAPEQTIAIRDRRREQAPPEWLEAIARELERHEPGQLPFAVLVVELSDLERLRLQSTPAQLADDLASMERVLAATGGVIRERPGRCWVLVPGADRHAARLLAEGLAASLAGDEGRHLQALIGIAVYPADGRHAAALAAHADVDLIAARSARR
jgi:hypothetical protein